MNLLVLSDISQVKYLLQHQAAVLTSHRLMTQDFTVAHELERLQIPFLDEFCYLSPADIEENGGRAAELAEVWQQHALGGDGQGLEIAALAKQDLVWPLDVCLNARTVYQRILESETVESLSGYWLPPQPIFSTGPAPVTRAAASLAQAILHWMAEQNHIPIRSLQCPRPLSVETLGWRARQPPAPVPVSGRPANCYEKVVLLLETGLRAHEQAVLKRHFEATAEWRLVRISPWELGRGGLFAAAMHQTEFDAAMKAARRDLEKNRMEYKGAYPEIFSNRYLEFQFLRILDEIQLAARIGTAFASILDVLQPSLLILGHDAFTRERMLVQQAKRRGIPTVSLIHGGLWHLVGARGIVGLSDHFLVWGEEDIRLLKHYGIDSARIHSVGSLQYAQKYSRIDQICAVGQGGERHTLAKKRLALPTKKPVVALLTASTGAGFAQVIADPPRHRETWKELVRLAEGRPDITFVIKPHPSYDHFEFYRHLTKYGPKNLMLVESATLDGVLAAAQVVVLVNYCTTAALEAMLARIPVVFIRKAILPLSSREDSLKKHGAIPVTSREELESVLDRLLRDDVARAAAIDDAKWALRQSLGEKDRPVVSDIGAFLDQVCSRVLAAADGCREAGAGGASIDKLAASVRLQGDGGGVSRCLQAMRDVPATEQNASMANPRSASSLFSMAYSLSLSPGNPSALWRLAQESFAAMESIQPLPVGSWHEFVLTVFLAAMIRAIDSGQWGIGRAYARCVMKHLPGRAVRSPLFRKYLIKGIVGSSRLMLALTNLAEYVRFRWTHSRPMRYQNIR